MQLSYGSKLVNGKWRGGKGQRAVSKERRAKSKGSVLALPLRPSLFALTASRCNRKLYC